LGPDPSLHRLTPLERDLLAEALARLQLDDIVLLERALAVVLRVDLDHRLRRVPACEGADLRHRDRSLVPRVDDALDVHLVLFLAGIRLLSGFRSSHDASSCLTGRLGHTGRSTGDTFVS